MAYYGASYTLDISDECANGEHSYCDGQCDCECHEGQEFCQYCQSYRCTCDEQYERWKERGLMFDRPEEGSCDQLQF
jgi:hypothetical protein